MKLSGHRHLKNLRKRYQEKYEETVELLLHGKTEKAEANYRWLELTEKVISKKQNSRLIPLLIGIAGIICLSITFAKVNSTHVQVTLETENVGLELDETIKTGLAINSKELDVSSITSVDLGVKSWDKEQLTNARISVVGQNTLRLAEIHESSMLSFLKNNRNLSLTISNDSISGDVQLESGIFQIKANETELDTTLDSRSLIIFETLPIGRSVYIEASETDEIEDLRVLVRSLNFNRKVRSGEFRSGITDGKITIPATRDEFVLSTEYVLDIELLKEAPVVLTFNEDRIQMKFSAEVSELLTGNKGNVSSIKPTIIDYLYKNEQVAFYGSSLIWIWGMMWSLKNTVFRKN